MKQLIRGSILLSMLSNQLAFALDPIQGFYGGVFGELSHATPVYYLVNFSPPPDIMAPTETFLGRVKNSKIGAGGGGVLGYRLYNFRVEGEGFYNWVSAGTLQVGTCTLQSPDVLTPTDPFGDPGCPLDIDSFAVNRTGFNGSTTSIMAMFNAYYDFYTADSESAIVPYIGVGIGGGRSESRINIINTLQPLPNGITASAGSKSAFNNTAAQGIVGVSVFIDDYTWASMDYRYLSTGRINYDNTKFINQNNDRFSLQMLTFNVNFSFDNSAD